MERAIRVMGDVKDLNDWLRGAGLNEARLVPSGDRVSLVVDLTRAMFEQPPVRRGLFKQQTPWTACRLTLNGITQSTVKRVETAPDETPLIACDAIHNGYQCTVQAPDGMQFVLTMETLDGRLTDVGSPIAAP